EVPLAPHRSQHRSQVGLLVDGRHHPPTVREPAGQILITDHRRRSDTPLADDLLHPRHIPSRAARELDDLAVATTRDHQFQDPAIVGQHLPPLESTRQRCMRRRLIEQTTVPVPPTQNRGTNCVDYPYQPALRATSWVTAGCEASG